VAIVVLVAAVAVALIVLYGRITWQRSTQRLYARIESDRIAPAVTVFDSAEVSDLPAPVRRYFATALRQGQPIVTGVVLEHAGTFNMSETGEQWRPFSSTQKVVTRRPGFVWDARIAMAPAVPVRAHDAYVAGRGILKASVLGLIPVADMAGTPDMDRGELMRFFAEAAWYPTALLPSQGVRWEAQDESSARATLVDGAHALEMTFVFGEDGLIASVRAEARGRTSGDTIVQTPWEGRWADYERRDGMMVPTSGEVAWLMPAGRQPYWRGRIVDARYEFAPVSTGAGPV
jgi:hypothetical protein